MSSDILLSLEDSRPVHFMGIAGAGMSALASLLRRRGIPVTGCDAAPTEAVINDLAKSGVQVWPEHSPTHVAGSRAVVVTSAVSKDSDELQEARKLGIPVIRRAEALGAVVSGGELIGVAGTHGKSTTTVMTTLALKAAGFDPTGIVGGRVPEWDGNLSDGGNELFVVEADEYDRSFLALAPTIAVVTSIEADHLDIYGDVENLREAFEQYVKGARAIIRCADDAGAISLPIPLSAESISYGITSPDARLVATDLSLKSRGSRFNVEFDGQRVAEVTLSVPGRYNILNALAAIACGMVLGADPSKMAKGLESFEGVERRFDIIASDIGGVMIVDDYAHHPTEVGVTLEAAREGYPDRRIVAAFQPHLYTRTRDFAYEFAVALAVADAVYLADIYPAREKPIPGITSQTIADFMAQIGAGGLLSWIGPRSQLAQVLAEQVRPGDLVLTIGAGDITKTSTELAKLLTENGVKSS